MEDKKNVATGDFVSSDSTQKQQTVKKVKQKNKTPSFFSRIGAKIKDVFSELKKVSWPTFGKVVKQTGVVLVVVLVFLVVITAFDFGLTKLVGLIR